MNHIPLAERMRPERLSDVVGQDDILGDGKILTEIAKKGEPVNLIFWGPPGTGKTTLARILAREFHADFVEISAVTAGKKDVAAVVERARTNWNLQTRTVLFVDEIHRFNKAQQDAFLPHVESGLITLIGATTENPSFEVISPLLSRSRVVVIKPLSKDAILEILARACEKEGIAIDDEALDYLAELSGGDARSALGDLELAASLASHITKDTVIHAAGKKLPGYDKKGDHHYDTISAFIKSLRGSDVDAALYYLARMVQSGEDPKFIARRMVIFASEDIGLAGNGALSLATACFQAVERVGMPESGLILAHTTVALAKSKKSRATTDAWYAALDLAKKSMHEPVPLWLRNAPTKLMQDLGYGAGQKWTAGFHLDKNYLPDAIKDAKLFPTPKPADHRSEEIR
ncbi:replication-associated recombination protein A [Candidatus Saccharibacteria bacterium]|nr:replication-associated recombination protein A [Candidatus Saccharibacteria bacterium]